MSETDQPNGRGPSSASNLPAHIAIIMDGNGRWAKSRGLERVEGHKAGAAAVRRAVEGCRKRGIRYLTLFSFSTENWKREPSEVEALMQLFCHHLETEREELSKTGIRLRAIGDLGRLPAEVQDLLMRDIDETGANTDLTLTLAVSYGAREEIVSAARKLSEQVSLGKLRPEDINAEVFSDNLWTAGIPDPDLLIRTSGEMRVSNFLLWQIAYAEIVVVPEFWPDFDETLLDRCIESYQGRERRFGMSSEQIRAGLERRAGI